MEQELTLSESIFDYLSKNLTIGRSKSSDCIELISDNYIVDDEDKTILKIFDSAINALDNIDFNIRKYLEDTLKDWMEKNRKKIDNIRASDWNSDILELCKLSQDKILFKPSYEGKEIKSLRKKYYEIEFHNLTSFLQPDSADRLRHLPFQLKLEQDICYDLNNILLPFVRKAKSLVIVEPYISSWQNLINFKKFSEIIPKSIPCKIIKFINTKEKELSDFDEFIKLSNRKGLNIIICHPKLPKNKSSKHIERYIITDKYKIYLPGGFNCLDENGYSNVSDDYDIKEISIERCDGSYKDTY